MLDLHRRFGKLPLSDLAAPAIAAARDGIRVTAEYSARCFVRSSVLSKNADAHHMLAGLSKGQADRRRSLLKLFRPVEALRWEADPIGTAKAKALNELRRLASAAACWVLSSIKHYLGKN